MDVINAGLDRDETIEQARGDTNFLAMLCIPEIFKFFYPKEYIAIWQMFVAGLTETFAQIAIGLPRGFSKTVFLKIFVVYCILFSEKRFIIVVCNTQDLAENFIADVVSILNSLNILSLFGRWDQGAEMTRQNKKKFRFRGREIVLAALGAGSSLRGLNVNFLRPDMILCDDIQSREQAKSDVESKAMLEWFQATLVKARSYDHCIIIFVGNMYPYECALLKLIKRNPRWVTFITAGILEDFESLWPELRSLKSLLDELESDTAMNQPEIFYAEVMNDEEAGTRSGVDITQINTLVINEMYQPQAGFIIVDPSAAKKKSDDVAIGCCMISEQEPALVDLEVGRFNPGQQCSIAIDMAVKHGVRVIVLEDVAYQSTLKFWMDIRRIQLGLTDMIILLINPEGETKTSRIMAMLKQLTAKKERVWVHPDVRTRVVNQIIYYDPMKVKNKDDILDIMAYMYKVMAKYKGALILPLEMQVGQKIEAAFSDTLAIAF